MPGLSELEGTVLGLIGRDGGCTPYAVRREFAGSLTARWRASAGAVYPLLARLEAAGLVDATSLDGDRRGTRVLRLTAKGAERLRTWIEETPAGLAAAPPDPIRTRAHFLEGIAASERAALVRGWIEETEAELGKLDEDRRERDRFARMALAGARMQLATRLDWLRSVLAELRA